MVKIRDWIMIYMYQQCTSVNGTVIFVNPRGVYFRETPHTKFRENKPLATISEFTVTYLSMQTFNLNFQIQNCYFSQRL